MFVKVSQSVDSGCPNDVLAVSNAVGGITTSAKLTLGPPSLTALPEGSRLCRVTSYTYTLTVIAYTAESCSSALC